MPVIRANQLVDRCSEILNDTTGVRWPKTQLLQYLNDGQREVVLLRPDASVSTQSIPLVPSTTRQSIPSNGIRLMTVVRNMGTDGVTPGRAIRMVDRSVLDTQLPNWHSDTPQAEVVHFVFDPVNPRIFYVYPRPTANRQVEIIYSTSPAEVGINDLIGIDDIYANAIINYILYRAYSKDADYAQNMNLADGYWKAFVQALGLKTQMDTATDPNGRPILGQGMDR